MFRESPAIHFLLTLLYLGYFASWNWLNVGQNPIKFNQYSVVLQESLNIIFFQKKKIIYRYLKNVDFLIDSTTSSALIRNIIEKDPFAKKK